MLALLSAPLANATAGCFRSQKILLTSISIFQHRRFCRPAFRLARGRQYAKRQPSFKRTFPRQNIGALGQPSYQNKTANDPAERQMASGLLRELRRVYVPGR